MFVVLGSWYSTHMNLTLTARIEKRAEYLLVTCDCNERPDLPTRFGMSVGSNQKLGERLVRAVNDGVAWTDVSIKTDVHGNEYVYFSTIKTVGRRLNADLKRLGY